MLTLIFLIILTSVKSNVIINRYDETCHLDAEFKKEIASYKDVVDTIMSKVKSEYGEKMYTEYENFIDQFGPRLSGTPTLEAAIDHMINLTRQYGVEDVTTEELEVPHWSRVHESGMLLEPRIKKIPILAFGYSVSAPSGGITAEAIVIKSFDELDKTDKESIHGKIVVFDPDFVSYGETVVYRSEGATRASAKGAVATLVKSVTPFSLYTLHGGMQSYGDNVTKIPTAAITIEDADLFRRFQNKGHKIKLYLDMTYQFERKKSRNTIIDVKGRENPEKIVLVSGHIDSWDVGQGAIDDGGGMIISWFAPIVIKALHLQPRRTLRAILWTSEELGLIGAQAYLKRHEKDLDKFNLVMESDEGTFKPLGLEVAGTNEARCIIAEVLKLFTPIDKLVKTSYPGSDIIVFVDKGIPGASLSNENERYYWYHHTDADTMSAQNKTNVIECAAFWAAVSYVISDLSIDIPKI